MNKPINPIQWQDERVLLIDQRVLPLKYEILEINTYQEMAAAIKTMVVRGAPAIGVSAAYGLYLGARDIETDDPAIFLEELAAIASVLSQTRPTAVNLFWAINRVLETAKTAAKTESVAAIKVLLLTTAKEIHQNDVATCQAIGDYGLTALPDTSKPLTLLTHCNAGALATAGYGTAVGVIRSAWREGRLDRVFADETRPRLQGSKLTTWECVQEGIPVTHICDNMAAHCMQKKMIDIVVVGADRIAANGDAANKIGTYSLAIVAKAHNVPFYVAAPLSTIDFSLSDGSQIPIEERDTAEVYQVGDTRICPEGVDFYNPAFDVTPADLITGIITEHGVFEPNDLITLKS
ncbi:methylthioribose-1-phosphate isomerase [[Leptolyngbya] sp. PCC 7376]|uniref:S-methyl-5-thioribose-1-phosphate isomerase n=1 Tax=[Leptolyngbya] sp. PCC 7376 TaxID=111781 RepID=UPI00029F3003|nr:S-methyl-5-thioribose-1-phosphate isomerase [[Leptolyngbya] sp. PCC 7376]AFY36756.1 methylthioribose-1-phosphate isomerase [[Leptolyngbya] sp. PCC 7376]